MGPPSSLQRRSPGRGSSDCVSCEVAVRVAETGLLVDARGTVAMRRKALEMAANNPVNDRTVATALLVDSPVSTLLVNFFIRFARPPYPARAFRDPQSARQWLLEHLVGKS